MLLMIDEMIEPVFELYPEHAPGAAGVVVDKDGHTALHILCEQVHHARDALRAQSHIRRAPKPAISLSKS